jgi:hypothetical protein
VCRNQSCSNGVQTFPARCDGNGACPPAITKPCDPFVCDPATSACKTSCAADADCATAGDHCIAGMCVTGSTCDKDGHTAVDPAGNRTECSPYACSSGTCATSCMSVDDCAVPNVCDPTGHCIAPSAGSAGSSGGCAVGARGAPETGAPWAVFLAACTIAGAKRRAKSGSVRGAARGSGE